MKILYFTDPHVMGKNPRSRKDEFPRTILDKLDWVLGYADRNGITTVLCGGDLFHRPDTAESVVNDVIDVVKRYPSITIYGVGGNHDFYGYNPDTIPRTMLGILDKTGIYKLIKPGEVHKIGNVIITGQHADYRLDRGNEWGYVGTAKSNDWGCPGASPMVTYSIHISHGFLTDHKWPDMVPHTVIDDIQDKVKCDLLLTGHDHHGFGIIKRGEKTFCNPGALGRISAAVGEMNRDVNVCVIDTDTFEVSLIPVSIALPADEILDRAELEKEKEQERGMNMFIAEVGEFSVEVSGTLEVIEAIAGREELDEAVIAESIKRIEIAHEAIGGVM